MHKLAKVLRASLLVATAAALALGLAAVASGAPALSIVAGPDGPTNDATPTFGFGTEVGATLECSIDQGDPNYVACSEATAHTPSEPLADGAYTFRVRATDEALEQTVATRSFIVDTVPPAASISSGPSGPTNDATPTFGFGTEVGAAVVCSVDQGNPSYGPCSGAGSHTPATLADGAYTFRVRAIDAAGNTGVAATRSFSVDTVAPSTAIDSPPLGTTANQSPAFSFSATGDAVGFQCRRDGEADFTACSSPKSYSGLTEGGHVFAVRAVDAAGNVDATPATESFTIDLTSPSLTIVEGPSGPTNENDPQFEFVAESGTTVVCSIDQGDPTFGPCSGSSEHEPAAPLADGAYFFRVRASDAVPHQTTVVRSFTVDTVAPDTTIVSGPTGLTNGASPTFGFSATEAGSTFECRRDAETFAPCGSPTAYSGLADGSHSFQVRATDAAGNVDPTVASRAFQIDTVAPTVSIEFGPLGTTDDDSPLFEFAVGAEPASVACSIDQGTPSFGSCSSATSHVVAQRLADGAYTFRVRATDAAGNAAVATRSFTVATSAAPPTEPEPPTQPATPAPPSTPATVAPTVVAPQLLSPFPLVRLAGGLTRSGVKVRILTVRAPRGAQVQVRVQPKCAAKDRRTPSCKAKQASANVGAKGTVRFKRLELGYRAGTVIEIRVSRAGLIGKYTRFVVRRGKAPQRQDRCLMPGAKGGSACPSA